MPYHLRKKDGKTCVVKGTKDDPGETMKCYSDPAKAKKYLAALYINVEDAKKEALLQLYKEQLNETKWQDRWIAVSTVQMWDRQGEMFTTDAMDYEIARVQQTKEYPEFRMFHVRGLKLGMCDSMQRINDYAVDQGYWFETPFAQAVKEVVEKNQGRWKISRGFYTVEATGDCPSCGESLMVGPINYITGVPCRACGEWHKPSMLTRFKHLKTSTFDITLTDVPAVVQTAVAAYTVQT